MQSSRKYQKVLATKQYHQDMLLATPGVHGVGIGMKSSPAGEDAYIIQIFFDKTLITSDAVEIKRTLPKSLDGVETTIIEISQFRPCSEAVIEEEDAGPLLDQAKYRPVPPGCQITIINPNNTLAAGTLGCFALTSDTVAPIPVLISNQHVLHIANAIVYQPTNSKNDEIAKVVRQALTPTVDAAAAVIKSGVTTTNMIAATNTSITGTAAPTMPSVVSKRGRSTEYTSGPVVSLSFSGVRTDGWRFEEQGLFGAVDGPVVSQMGDSGSPVFVANGAMATLVGILWGSNAAGTFGAFSPIQFVTAALNVNILTGGGDRAPVAHHNEGARIAEAAAAVQAIPAGAVMVDVYRNHEAFRRLVKGNPAVEVAWARAYSCNIITAILNWILDGEAPFPTVLNGTSMDELADSLEAAFMYHGDEEIRAIVRRVRGPARLAFGKTWGEYLKALRDYK